MQRDALRLNNATPVDVRTGAVADGEYLKYDEATGTIIGDTPAGGGGMSQAQALTLVSYRG